MTQDNKNLYLAIALSILVIIGWNYFYAAPQMERARQTQAQLQQPATAPQPQGRPGSLDSTQAQSPSQQGGRTPETPALLQTREEPLAAGPRIKLDTPSLYGSIDLKGGRIDDVSFKNYR